MYSLIFSAAFLLVAALVILVGALKGRKYKWQYSLSKLIAAVVAVVISAILASVISNAIVGAATVMVIDGDMIGDIANIDLSGMIKSLDSGILAIKAFGSMIVAPILFIPIFILIKAIINIFVKLISLGIASVIAKKGGDEVKDRKYVERKHYKKRNEVLIAHYPNYVGGLLGALCAVFVLCAFICPFTGTIGVVNSIAPVATHSLAEDEEYGPIVNLATEVLDGAANNAATVAVTCTGGKLYYGAMTCAVIDGELTNLNKEAALFAAVADAAGSIYTEGTESHETAEAIRNISPAFDKSVVVRTIVAELCAEAGDDWQEGHAYYGINRPNFGANLQPITDSLINVFATSDKENIKGDVKTITEAVAVLADKGLMTKIMDTKNPMVILSDEKATAELINAFLDDERLDPLVDGVADFGVTTMLNSVKTPLTREQLFESFVVAFAAIDGTEAAALEKAYANILDDYGIRSAGTDLCARAAQAKLGGQDMTAWFYENVAMNAEEFVKETTIVSQKMLTEGMNPITNREHESQMLAHAFVLVYGMTDDIQGGTFDVKNMLATMGPALDSFSKTETIGQQKTKYMLEAILQSSLVHDQIGFGVVEATDSAASIADNSANKSYASVMASLSGVVEVLEAAADKTKNTKEAVDKMLADLTPEAASVMETMATPSVMQNYGVPEKSAESVATMVSGTFGNLKDVPPEDYEKESAAVADMMNVMMSITEDGASGSSVFGGEDSVTEITEDEYVSNIMGSSAMSKTVVDTVYGEGDEPKVDPFNSGRNLSDTEKSNLVSSLNDKWNSSDKDADTKKQVTAIAAIMNVPVIVTDAGVELVVVEDGTGSDDGVVDQTPEIDESVGDEESPEVDDNTEEA
jgi:hypothetical protein